VVEVMKTWGIQSGCALPLTTVQRRLGVLFFGSDRAEAYSEEDISFLSLAADPIAAKG
jgi:putative methionine-R-sulfoxide reductase with GAF domain